MAQQRYLSARPRDFVYFCFFLMHILISLIADFQALYPQSLVPGVLKKINTFYIESSGDPLMSSAFNYYTPTYSYIWFRTFLWLELIFQLPVFILGARGLWRDSPSIYPLLLVYGASTSTTLLPCLATVLAVPTATDTADALTTPAVTTSQRLMLLASYVPFLLVPLAMTLDMAWRLLTIIDTSKKHVRGDAAARIKRE